VGVPLLVSVTRAEGTPLVLVMYGAKWCRFSQALAPIWRQLPAHYAGREADVRLASVECTAERESPAHAIVS